MSLFIIEPGYPTANHVKQTHTCSGSLRHTLSWFCQFIVAGSHIDAGRSNFANTCVRNSLHLLCMTDSLMTLLLLTSV